MTMCFQEGGDVSGVAFGHNGLGGDFCYDWYVLERRIVFEGLYPDPERCSFGISGGALALTECELAGNWKRDDRFGPDSWPCSE